MKLTIDEEYCPECGHLLTNDRTTCPFCNCSPSNYQIKNTMDKRYEIEEFATDNFFSYALLQNEPINSEIML